MRQLPELKDKIQNGQHSVTTISQIQVYLRQQQAQGTEISLGQKQDFFQQFENKTAKEVKVAIMHLRGEHYKTKLLIELDDETEVLWNLFRGETAHQTQGDVLNGFKLLLKHWNEKKLINSSAQSRRTSSLSKEEAPITDKNTSTTRSLSTELKDFIWNRDQGKCTQCSSTYALQIDHRVPFSMGGSNEPDNLRLLCRNCNLHEGVQIFGTEKLQRGLPSPSSQN